MLFCPHCGNMLLAENVSSMRFFCQTCAYVQPVHERITKKMTLVRKRVDDVLGGDKAWESVDTTGAKCPECDHERAYFMQMQTRSADEPMTIFYRCVRCKHTWSG